MASETVNESGIGVTSNRSIWRLHRWQWATIILLALGQGFSIVYAPFLIAGRILGGVLILFLFAVFFRFAFQQIGLTENHNVLAVCSIVAALISTPLAVVLINPLYVYPFILVILYPVVWVLATGYQWVAS